ncbi:hypothetical protein ACF09J_34675 [Streptomyces sp. NPDC014889]|uniref:hypothetical protein n=1 Tax=Streptomyces sp. NPDC014889 TaxID=3364928 RepID=UPI0036FA946E
MHLEPRPGIAWPSPHLRELKVAVRALLGLDDDTAVAVATVPAVSAVPLAAASGCPSRTISSACIGSTSGASSASIPVYIGSAAPGSAAAATGTATAHFSKLGPFLDDAKGRTLCLPEAAKSTTPTGGAAYAFAWPPPLTSGTHKAARLPRAT